MEKMTPKNRPSHREAMRDEAAKTRSLRQCSTSNEHLDKAVSWYLNIGFQDGADWQQEQDKARIEKLEAALQRLTKVGPPSRSCTGLEYAQVCLEDNCRIAIEALERP